MCLPGVFVSFYLYGRSTVAPLAGLSQRDAPGGCGEKTTRPTPPQLPPRRPPPQAALEKTGSVPHPTRRQCRRRCRRRPPVSCRFRRWRRRSCLQTGRASDSRDPPGRPGHGRARLTEQLLRGLHACGLSSRRPERARAPSGSRKRTRTRACELPGVGGAGGGAGGGRGAGGGGGGGAGRQGGRDVLRNVLLQRLLPLHHPCAPRDYG